MKYIILIKKNILFKIQSNAIFIIFLQIQMQSLINQKKKLYDTLLSFPPFFTLQQHNQSRKKQVNYWAQMIHNYCRDKNIINTSISQIQSFSICQDKSGTIPKKLNKQDLVVIMKQLQRLGCCQFTVGVQKLLISHFSPYQMADDMYRWAKQNYLIGDVQTLQFISQGQHTNSKQKFYKQPKQILIKVIEILQKQNKACRIEVGSDISVKFL